MYVRSVCRLASLPTLRRNQHEGHEANFSSSALLVRDKVDDGVRH